MQGVSSDNSTAAKNRRRWSRKEIELLKGSYGLMDEESLAKELKRSRESVARMAATLFTPRSGPWTARELENLRRYLGATNARDVIARALGRDVDEVQGQILELGRVQTSGRWGRADQLRFKRLYGRRSDQELAVIFSRSIESVRRLAARLCLAKDKVFVAKESGRGATRMPRWSARELGLLREAYAQMPNLELAQRLNRSIKSVVSKAHHIGLRKDPQRLQEMGRENVRLRADRR